MKKRISLLLVLSILLGISGAMQPAGEASEAIPQYNHKEGTFTYYYLEPDDFTLEGKWIRHVVDGVYVNALSSDLTFSTATPGNPYMELDVKEEGDYYIYARTRDFAEGQGIRRFCVAVNGAYGRLEFGKHGFNGWDWEMEPAVFHLKPGKNKIELKALGDYARVTALIVTDNWEFQPEDEYAALSKQLNHPEKMKGEKPIPSVFPSDNDGGPSVITIPQYHKQDNTYTYYYLAPDDFTLAGKWVRQVLDGVYVSALSSDLTYSSGKTENPYIEFEAKEAGDYTVFARTRDFTEGQGTRKFSVVVNGKESPFQFGQHGTNGWDWEKDPTVFHLEAGKTKIELKAISDYARMTAMVVTNDEDYEPEDDYAALAQQLSHPKQIIVPDGITVTIDEVPIDFRGDQEPIIMEETDRVMVPLRKIFESLGATVEWSDETETVTAVKGNKRIALSIGNSTARKNGVPIKLDQPPLLLNDRTMVPVRFVAEAFDNEVNWKNASQTVVIKSSKSDQMVYLRPESFTTLGTWTLDANPGAFGGSNLRGLMPLEGEESHPENAKNAEASFDVVTPGTYKVYTRTRDFATNKPGERFCNISINGTMLKKTLGKHGTEGWAWEEAGTVTLSAGKNKLELVDTSGYWPRVDGVWLTLDQTIPPPETYEKLVAMVKPYSEFANVAMYPEWALTTATPDKEYEISNENIKIKFYQTPSGQGDVIQKETYVKKDGAFIQADDRLDQFGYLLMYAKKADNGGYIGRFPAWNSTFDFEGEERSIVTGNAFQMGMPYWLIPTGITVAENTAVLTASCDVADFSVQWTMPEDGSDPMVTWTLTPKADGDFSVGMINGPEIMKSNLSFINNPYTFHSLRLPNEAYLVSEAYSTAALTTATTKENEEGYKLTYGVAIDPSSIPDRWAYENNSLFGMGILGQNGGAQAYAFAPLYGTGQSTFQAGESFQFTYRPVTMAADWDETYSHIVQTVFHLTDYRKNYFASLTDASFNMYDLMMDDYYGGWDPIVKAPYNMEGRNVATHSDVLAYIQPYLLTEDDEFYEQRTIPTMEFMLTRGRYHFTASTVHDGTGNYLDFKGVPHELTGPIDQFGTPVYGGAYYMTRGQSPVFAQIGMGDEPKKTPAFYVPPFADYVYLYQYTGEKKHLDKAIELADQYLASEVYADKETIPSDDLFIMLSYYPNWISLMDLYEVTKEAKYLNAAAYSAKWALTTLWTQPIAADWNQNIEIKAEDVISRAEKREELPHMYWRGNERLHLNFKKGREMLQDETVPEWLPSRVGLGLEQTSTFKGGEQSNALMSNWAPDLIRLSQYTGDDLFEIYARNAVIGRYANYPGYYINQPIIHIMKENYPYEGPDYSGIYYHHIPLLMTTAQDFLITQSWKWSNEAIHFPNVRQLGYVWFINKHYGYDSGQFFDMSDMWLWLKRGLITPDNMQIDWIGARKDGVAAFALMNEDTVDITTKVAIGGEVADNYSGPVTLYDAEGKKSNATAENGTVTVTVPAKGLTAFSIQTDKVKKPAFAEVDEAVEQPTIGWTQATSSGEDKVNGVVLQIDPTSYFAYIYTTRKYNEVKKATLVYTLEGGKQQSEVREIYPFEFTVRVDDPARAITYHMEIETPDGKTIKSPVQTIKADLSARPGVQEPNRETQTPENDLKFDLFTVNTLALGVGIGGFRAVVSTDPFPFPVTENSLAGIRMKVVLTSNSDGSKMVSEMVITGNEMRDGSTVILADFTDEIPQENYGPTHSGQLTIVPPGGTMPK